MRRKVEIIITCSMAAILVMSVAWAGSYAGQPIKSGTAADFAVTFPWVVVSLVVVLFAVVGGLIKKYDDQREAKIDQAIKAIGETNESLAKATGKLDATINTLFERDRDIEHEVSILSASVAGIKATCAARGKMCLLSGSKIACLDRRDGEDRRDEDNGQN